MALSLARHNSGHFTCDDSVPQSSSRQEILISFLHVMKEEDRESNKLAQSNRDSHFYSIIFNSFTLLEKIDSIVHHCIVTSYQFSTDCFMELTTATY